MAAASIPPLQELGEGGHARPRRKAPLPPGRVDASADGEGAVARHDQVGFCKSMAYWS
jgi:hypothetical protein